jgi:thiol:disulfide interchange protein
MPCVYPMLPMTIAFFAKSSKTRSEGIKKGLIYGVSIIAIFFLIGIGIVVLFGAAFPNFLSTSWIPNIFFFLVFFIFALSFLGMFELELPSSFVNKMDANADKGGYIGIFFMAFTLVLVSFSCTAPIIGTASILASKGGLFHASLLMFSFAVAFALPFMVFAMLPHLLQGLPKSGGWLNTLKVCFGLLELAIGLKFLSTPDQTYHWGLLTRPVYLSIWIVIFLMMGLNIIGKIRMPHDSKMETISVPRLIISILVFSFVIYLTTGLLGEPLRNLSGLLPPETSSNFGYRGDQQKAQSKRTLAPDGSFPRFSDIEGLKLPHNLSGFFDYKEAVAYAKKVNKPIFIDFTGHGCVNCRQMESKVWSDDKVLERLKNDYIVVALYVDDKFELPKSEWYISKDDNSEKSTIGDQNLDFEISKFNGNAQPYYCLINSQNEQLLSSPKGYDSDVSHFIKFLDEGKAKFAEKK